MLPPGLFSASILTDVSDNVLFSHNVSSDISTERGTSQDRKKPSPGPSIEKLVQLRHDVEELLRTSPYHAATNGTHPFPGCTPNLPGCHGPETDEYRRLVTAYRDIADLFSPYTETLRRLQINSLPCVAVCGELKAGKSSLLNMLTGDLTGQSFSVDVVRKTQTCEKLEHDGFIWMDTPGINASQDDDRQTLFGLMSADYVLFVHSFEEEPSSAELQWLAVLQQLFGTLDDRMAVVISRKGTNNHHAAGREKSIRTMLTGQFGLHDVPVFFVDSRSYQKGVLEKKNTLRTFSGVDDLRNFLTAKRPELVYRHRETLRQNLRVPAQELAARLTLMKKLPTGPDTKHKS